MSTIATTTLRQQRSFTADWLVSGSLEGFPQGVIVDLALVTTDTSPVYLGKLTVKDGVLEISFEQSNHVCAYGSIRGDGVTQALSVTSPMLSATITTGSLSSLDNVNFSSEGARISPELVSTVGLLSEGTTVLDIIQDDQITAYTLEADTQITVGYNLSAEYHEGALTVGMPEDQYNRFKQLVYPLTVPEIDKIVSINGVKSPSGILKLDISTSDGALPAQGNNKLVELDGTRVALCGTSKDIIDSYISPALHVAGYKPLDDVYDITPGGPIRNTLKVVSSSGYGLNGAFGITDIDTNIDTSQEE